jgi:hypothetical protein
VAGLLSARQALVLGKKRLDPVMVALLEDPIGDRRGLLRDGKAFAETLGEGFQHWPGQLLDGAAQRADGAAQRADGGRIEGEEPWILRGAIRRRMAGPFLRSPVSSRISVIS